LQWHFQKKALEYQQLQLLAQESEGKQRRTAFLVDEQRLDAHQRALPHRSLLERYEEGIAQLDLLSEELQQLQKQETEGKASLQELETQFQREKNAGEALYQQKKQLFPVYDEVIHLDKDLEARSNMLSGLI